VAATMTASRQARSKGRPSVRLALLGVLLLVFGLASSRALLAQAAQPASPTGGQKPSSPPAAPAANLPRGQKLFLKDGTFELVSSYKIDGDRVRYYSVERSEWEEVPASLVDWDATKKAQAEEAREEQEQVEKVRKEIQAEKAAAVDVDASIEVQPGLFLPPGEGVYLVEGGSVLPLTQNPAAAKLDTGRLVTQILVPVPLPGKRTVVLAGKHAQLRTQNSEPVFYYRSGDADQPQLAMIHARIQGGQRQIEDISSFFGQTSEKAKAIPMKITPVARGVFRLLPEQDLDPGEYVLAEILPKQKMNLDVWDFGIDPPAKAARQAR
jgi:hypothetical protein